MTIQRKRAIAVLSMSALMGSYFISAPMIAATAAEGDPPPVAEVAEAALATDTEAPTDAPDTTEEAPQAQEAPAPAPAQEAPPVVAEENSEPAPMAAAAPAAQVETEITAKWDRPERELDRNSLVTATVQMNRNLPEGVDVGEQGDHNRTLTFVVDKGIVTEIPEICQDNGSSLSADSKTLTCVVPTTAQAGDAKAVPVVVMLDGYQGETLTARATDEYGKTATLEPIRQRSKVGLDVAIGSAPGSVEAKGGYISVSLGVMLPSGAIGPDTSKPIKVDLRLTESGPGNVDTIIDQMDWIGQLVVRDGLWGSDRENRIIGIKDPDPSLTPKITARMKSKNIVELTITDYKKYMDAARHVRHFLDGTDAGGIRAVMANTLVFSLAPKYSFSHASGSGTIHWSVAGVSYTNKLGQVSTTDLVSSNNSNSTTYNLKGGWTANLLGEYTDEFIRTRDKMGLTIVKKAPNKLFQIDSTKRLGSGGWAGTTYLLPGQVGWGYGSIFLDNKKENEEFGGLCVLKPENQNVYFTGNVIADGAITRRATGVKVEYTTERGNIIGKPCEKVNGWTTTAPSDMRQVTGMRFTNLRYGYHPAFATETHRANIRVQFEVDANAPAGRNAFFSWSWNDKPITSATKYWTAKGDANSYATQTAWKDMPINKPVYTTDYLGDKIPGGGEYINAITVGSIYTQTNLYMEQGKDVLIGGYKGVSPTVAANVPTRVSGKYMTVATSASAANVTARLVQKLPSGATYVPGSVKGNLTGEPTISTDPQTGNQVLTWNNVTATAGSNQKPFSYDVKFTKLGVNRIDSEFSIPSRATTDGPLATSTDFAEVAIVPNGETVITKEAEDEELSLNWNKASSAWTITHKNLDARTQQVMDSIDILPFNGDSTIRPANPSNLSGTLEVTDITPAAGTEVYVTTAAQKTLVSDPADPKNSVNGAIGSVTSIWKRWDGSAKSLLNVTGIRFISRNVGGDHELKHRISFTVFEAIKGDTLVNSVVARATTTGLQTREAAINIAEDEDAPKLPYPTKELATPTGEIAVRAGQVVEWNIRLDVPKVEAASERSVTIVDNLGEGFEDFKVVEVSDGSFDGNKWTFGPYYPGRSYYAKVQARIKEGFNPTDDLWLSSLTNSVSIEGDPVCPDGDNCHVHLVDNTNIRIDKQRVTEIGSDESENGILRYLDKVFYKVVVKADEGERATIAYDVVVEDLGDMAGGTLEDVTFKSPSKGSITDGKWLVGDLEPGESATIWVEGTVGFKAAEQKKVINRVITHNLVHPKTPKDSCEVNTGLVDTDGDQCDEVEDPVLPFAPPRVDKTLDTDLEKVALAPGRQIDYTITVNVDSDSSGVPEINLADLGGKYLKDIVLYEPSAGDIEGTVLKHGHLPHDGVITVKAKATITDDYKGGEIINKVNVGGGEKFPPPPHTPDDPANACELNEGVDADTDQCDYVPVTPDSKIRVDKVRVDENGEPYNAPVMPGEEMTYLITAKNAGPHAVADVSVDDLGGRFQNDITFTGASKGSVDGDAWTIGDMEAGETQTAMVTTRVGKDALGFDKVDNVVIIKSTLHPKDKTRQGDPNKTVDEDEDQWDRVEDPLVPPSKPQIDKSIFSDLTKLALSKGSTIEYTLTVKARPDGAGESGVVVTERGGNLLENVVMSDPSKGEIVGDKWMVGFMEPGEVQTAHVSATIKENAGTRKVVNTVTVTGDHYDPPRPPVTPDGDPGEPDFECVINDEVSADDDGCDSVPVVEESQLQIDKVRINDPANLEMEGGQRHAGEKAKANGKARDGETITYLVSVLNSGKHAAAQVRVADLGDLEHGSVSNIGLFDPSKGTLNEDGSWLVGDMAAGEKATVLVKATAHAVLDSPVAINNAVVGNPFWPTPDPKKNNECVVNGVVVEDDDRCDQTNDPTITKLQVDKRFVSDDPDLSVGGVVEFDVTARAIGGVKDTNVAVYDLGGEHFKDVKFIEVPDGTSIDGDKWIIGDMTNGMMVSAKVQATIAKPVDGAKPVSNTVIIYGDDNPRTPPTTPETPNKPFKPGIPGIPEVPGVPGLPDVPGTPQDPDTMCGANPGDVTTDNDQCDVVQVNSNPDLRIDKVRVKSATNHAVENAVTYVGDTIYYTVEVGNMEGEGITTAYDVVMRDTVDENLSDAKIISVSQGAFDGVEWKVGTLKPGATAKAVVMARVAKIGKDRVVVNSATVWNPVLPPKGDPNKPGSCQVNDGLSKDNDRCDRVPTPVEPKPVPLAKTGANALVGLVVVGLGALGAGACLLWWKNKSSAIKREYGMVQTAETAAAVEDEVLDADMAESGESLEVETEVAEEEGDEEVNE